jgi:hypothetical protein
MYLIFALFSAFYPHLQPVMPPARLVWVLNPLTVPAVRSQRQDCRQSSSRGQASPLASVCPSAEPSFTWRALGSVKVSKPDLRKS